MRVQTVGEEPRRNTGGERKGAWPGVPGHAGTQGEKESWEALSDGC